MIPKNYKSQTLDSAFTQAMEIERKQKKEADKQTKDLENVLHDLGIAKSNNADERLLDPYRNRSSSAMLPARHSKELTVKPLHLDSAPADANTYCCVDRSIPNPLDHGESSSKIPNQNNRYKRGGLDWDRLCVDCARSPIKGCTIICNRCDGRLITKRQFREMYKSYITTHGKLPENDTTPIVQQFPILGRAESAPHAKQQGNSIPVTSETPTFANDTRERRNPLHNRPNPSSSTPSVLDGNVGPNPPVGSTYHDNRNAFAFDLNDCGTFDENGNLIGVTDYAGEAVSMVFSDFGPEYSRPIGPEEEIVLDDRGENDLQLANGNFKPNSLRVEYYLGGEHGLRIRCPPDTGGPDTLVRLEDARKWRKLGFCSEFVRTTSRREFGGVVDGKNYTIYSQHATLIYGSFWDMHRRKLVAAWIQAYVVGGMAAPLIIGVSAMNKWKTVLDTFNRRMHVSLDNCIGGKVTSVRSQIELHVYGPGQESIPNTSLTRIATNDIIYSGAPLVVPAGGFSVLDKVSFTESLDPNGTFIFDIDATRDFGFMAEPLLFNGSQVSQRSMNESLHVKNFSSEAIILGTGDVIGEVIRVDPVRKPYVVDMNDYGVDLNKSEEAINHCDLTATSSRLEIRDGAKLLSSSDGNTTQSISSDADFTSHDISRSDIEAFGRFLFSLDTFLSGKHLIEAEIKNEIVLVCDNHPMIHTRGCRIGRLCWYEETSNLWWILLASGQRIVASNDLFVLINMSELCSLCRELKLSSSDAVSLQHLLDSYVSRDVVFESQLEAFLQSKNYRNFLIKCEERQSLHTNSHKTVDPAIGATFADRVSCVNSSVMTNSVVSDVLVNKLETNENCSLDGGEYSHCNEAMMHAKMTLSITATDNSNIDVVLGALNDFGKLESCDNEELRTISEKSVKNDDEDSLQHDLMNAYIDEFDNFIANHANDYKNSYFEPSLGLSTREYGLCNEAAPKNDISVISVNEVKPNEYNHCNEALQNQLSEDSYPNKSDSDDSHLSVFQPVQFTRPCISRTLGLGERLIVWNVGFLEALLKNYSSQVRMVVENENPAIIVLVHKLQNDGCVASIINQLKLLMPYKYDVIFCCSEKLGFSRICLMVRTDSRLKPIGLPIMGIPAKYLGFDERSDDRSAIGFQVKPLDDVSVFDVTNVSTKVNNSEAIVMCQEFRSFNLVISHVPDQQGVMDDLLSRRKFDESFHRYMETLASSKPLIIGADLDAMIDQNDVGDTRHGTSPVGIATWCN